MTKELINPNAKERAAERWAMAVVDIYYIAPDGEKKHIHHEMDLEPPIASHPNYKIGIAEL